MIVNHDYLHDSRVLYTFAPKAKMIFSDIYIFRRSEFNYAAIKGSL